MRCTVCGHELESGAGSCDMCGAPVGSRAATGVKSACHACGTDLWSLTETCPRCGEKGYPGLRPSFGDSSRGRD
jgi:primosomal protein N'